MERFGPDPLAFFEQLYRETPPWDIGGPQPALMALLNDDPPRNPILDVGCGSGDLAIALAQQGWQVLGIDIVAAAITAARSKQSRLRPAVAGRLEFAVADAAQLAQLHRQFGAVVDSGFLHLLDPNQTDRYVDDLAAILVPGGRFYLLAFAVEFPIPNVPRQVSAEEVATRFSVAQGWQIQALRAADFLSRIASTPAISACIERRADPYAPSATHTPGT